MKTLIIFVLTGMIVLSSSAQSNITSFEYFIDQDNGFGAMQAIDVTDNIEQQQSFNIPFSNLEPGIHSVYFRCKNQTGLWSQTVAKVFLVQANAASTGIVTLEYSIDEMPYFGNATSVSFAEPTSDLSYALELDPALLDGLSVGPHVVYIRVKDNNQMWSHTQSSIFFKTDPLNSGIVGAEYFIGTDPGVGAAEEQGNYFSFSQPALSGIFPMNIPANLLVQGINVIGLRTKNSNGEFSHTQFFEVNVQIETFVVGTITDVSQTVCYNTIPDAMTVTTPAESINGGIQYQWYSRDDIANAGGVLSDWNLIAGANQSTFIPTTPLTGNTTFACYVVSEDGSDWMIGEVQYTVLPQPSTGSLVVADEVLVTPANPASINFQSNPTGSTNYSYQWYYIDGLVNELPADCSTEGWTLITNAISATYTPPAGLTNSRTYACFVTPIGALQCAEPCWAANVRRVQVDPVGVEEELETLISIYPNPAVNELYIQNLPSDGTTVKIIDATGKLIFVDVLADRSLILDVSNYSSGLYTLTFEIGGEVISKPFLKD